MSDVRTRRTRRLWLRAVTLEDLPAVLAIETDPMTNQHRPGGPPSAEDVEKHLRACVHTWREQHIGYWLEKYEQEAVGLAGLRPLTFRHRSCWNLCYRFSPRAWGRGLANEAAREAVAVAHALQPVLPVVARTRPSNIAAIKVAIRAGLDRRADLDTDGFAVLASDW